MSYHELSIDEFVTIQISLLNGLSQRDIAGRYAAPAAIQ